MQAEVVLPDRLAGHVQKGHPWIYVDVFEGKRVPPAGTVVTLMTRTGRPIGLALSDPGSPIALRVLTTDYTEADLKTLLEKRVTDAQSLRRLLFDNRTTAYRLIHGEGDQLPGLVVDRYAQTLVLKLDTRAWVPHLETLTQVLIERVKPVGIFLKGVSRHAQEDEDGETEARVLSGAPPPPLLEVRENGMRFQVDVRKGQKTGLFLDQRDNRALIRRYSAGKTVLNLFSYTGGFSLAAALGGATQVTSVDLAAGAVTAAKEHFTLNGLDPTPHSFVTGDVFEVLNQYGQDKRRFDVVIVDPPSFAPREDAVRKALSAYTKLNAKAMRRVTPGGFLGAASCSSHIPMERFLESLRESAAEAKRRFRLLSIQHEPPDHPVPLHFPEGRYLKFVLLQVT